MSIDSKMQNVKKGSRRSPPRFWVRPHRNLKWWNDVMKGNMIPEEWKENVRMSEHSFYIFQPSSFCMLPIVAGFHRQSTEILKNFFF